MMQVNPEVIEVLEVKGLRFVGKDETGKRMEVLFSIHLVSFF
jgi:CTP synthase